MGVIDQNNVGLHFCSGHDNHTIIIFLSTDAAFSRHILYLNLNLRHKLNIVDIDFNHIIAKCRSREREAQKELYRRFYSYGMSICIRYVEDKQEATLILNDGFLKVFNNIQAYDTQLDFKPWFKTIMVNTALNYLKKMKKFSKEINLETAGEVSVSDNLLSQFAYQELVNMIQQLSLAYRTVFNMYVLDGYKHEEIALQLGITVSTSKSNLTRAKEKLRTMINQSLDR